MMSQPRLGHINFINCLPLTYGLRHGGFSRGLSIEAAVPSVLNQLIINGELDASPVSSIVYAKHSRKLLILPDVSISANGGLESILFVAKRPIHELDGAQVALTNKSATSHCLLKIILQHFYHVNPADYHISGLSLDAGVLDDSDGVLFIGDDALYAYHNRVDGYYYYDLGEEWKRFTGLRMVYAVWVINRAFTQDRPADVGRICQSITGGFAYGLEHLDDAVDTLVGKMPFTTRQLSHYIRLLNYQFTPGHQKALLTYYRLAYDLGLIENVPEIEVAGIVK